MKEKLGCPHARTTGGAVKCAIYERLKAAGLGMDQLDHTLYPHTLLLRDGGEQMQCGVDTPEQRQRCIGAYIPTERLPILLAAVEHQVLLTYPGQRHTWARIFPASADIFLQEL